MYVLSYWVCLQSVFVATFGIAQYVLDCDRCLHHCCVVDQNSVRHIIFVDSYCYCQSLDAPGWDKFWGH